MSDGYTHATLSVRPGEPTGIRVGMHPDERTYIRLCGAGTKDAHLYITHGEVSVTIAPPARPVTGQDVQIARTLAAESAAYAAEIECMHTKDATPATAGTAA